MATVTDLLPDYKLFSPIELAPGLTLKNRIVHSPVTRARADIKTRAPSDNNVIYYKQRASAGLIITEGCAVSARGYGWYGTPGLYTDEQQEGWRKVVDAVHANGGKIFLQLWHAGRQSHPSYHPDTNEVISCSSSRHEGGRTRDINGKHTNFVTSRAMTLDEVKQAVDDFRTCAERAKAAGFDGVDILASVGFLIDEFLQSSLNKRTDEYGGSFENRFRFLREVIEVLTTVFPADRIGLRLAPNTNFGGSGSDDNYEMFSYVFAETGKMGLCYLATPDHIGLGKENHHKCRTFSQFEIKTLFKRPVMTMWRYNRELAEGAVHSGAVDLVGFGQLFMTNPDLVERFKNDWPLAGPLAYEFFYDADKGAEGYTEFLPYDPKSEERVDEKQKEQSKSGGRVASAS